jgi:murein DD-endopeptidase MepM/ murein hydrolase activator NlpD
MKSKFALCFALFALCCAAACDLQPKIASLPDSVGDFISSRYPALLADPEAQPDIYNSAATDYGVYASPEMYGSGGADDYLMYASSDDYAFPPQPAQTPVYGGEQTAAPAAASAALPVAARDDYLTVPVYDADAHSMLEQVEITVQKGDTLYSLSRKYSLSVEDLAKMNDLSAPYALSVGQKLKTAKPKELVTAETKAEIKGDPVKTELIGVTVGAGDTLYSLSRKFSVPVNELAVLNKLSAPFALSVGQNLQVPVVVVGKPAVSPVRTAGTPAAAVLPKTTIPAASPVVSPAKAPAAAAVAAPKPKISSDPSKALPAIAKRSASKFSWPVRGTVLSSFGAKTNGLFNDGVNISASPGAKVGAAENGVVAYAGNEVKGMGNLVIVQHSDGWMTVYAHMDKMSVRRGVKVSVGQQVGTVGQTGKVDKPQLHFEIRKGTKAYDPAAYLKK